MGVKHLWDIIDEIKTKESLEYLRGKIVSVDLSIWIVEAMKTLQFKTSILKPHLRNIIYRILALRKIGIKLLFVTEGEAPDLKQDTMKKRNEARYGIKSKTKGRVGRSRFQNVIKECCQLLDLLGMPYIRAAGEAEAMCAVLNSEGYSDGCLTNDGDFFLYGGETIFRDFGIDPKDPHVYVYKTSDIQRRLNIDRSDMIGLALIAGCDYTDGVVGVGKGSIKKFLSERNFSEDFLTRFKKWNNHDFLTTIGLEKSEILIAKKAMKTTDFLNQDIIDEYMISKDKLHNVGSKLKWEYPNIRGLQEFLNEKMEWPFDYTLSKIMQLASSTYLEKMSFNTFYPVIISPASIVKTRCQYGVPLVEIKWEKDDSQSYNADLRWENCPDTFNTIENHQAVLKSLPGLVEKFNLQKEAKKSRTKKKGKDSKKNIECSQEVSRKDSCGSMTKESQNSPASFLQRTAVSGDFLDDVLCDDMRGLSLNTEEKNEEHVKENVPPLFERLQKNRQREIDNHGTPRRNPLNEVQDSHNSVVKKKGRKKEATKKLVQTEAGTHQHDLSELMNNGFSPLTSSQNSTDPTKQHFTPRGDRCVSKSDDKTPVCLKFETPNVQNQTAELLASLGLTSSTPFERTIEAHSEIVLACNENTALSNFATPGAQNQTAELLASIGTSTPFRKTDEIKTLITPVSNENTNFLNAETVSVQNLTSELLSSVRLTSSLPSDETPTKVAFLQNEITSFSNLGDSILGHSMELFESNSQSVLDHSKKSLLYKSLDLCDNLHTSSGIPLDDSILCDSLNLDISNKVSDQYIESYEDVIRRKFEIPFTCTDVKNESLQDSDLSVQSNDISEIVSRSPLSLADRLKKRLNP